MSTRIEKFISMFFNNKTVANLKICIVKECHLCYNINLFNFLFVVYKNFLPMFLIYYVVQHRISIILYNLCFFCFCNHIFSVIVYLHFFQFTLFVELIFYLYYHNNVLHLFWFYNLYIPIIFVKSVDMFFKITNGTSFIIHLYLLCFIEWIILNH